ncbi:hypothetical protein HK22_02790 [Gluconobacter sp. DsW_056]|nr:hypothetical protein HK22_02790 [Gluconobacter sp. DsW_056]
MCSEEGSECSDIRDDDRMEGNNGGFGEANGRFRTRCVRRTASSQLPDLAAELEETAHPLLQHGPEHHHALQQARAFRIRAKALQPTFEQRMLDLDQTQHVMQAGMQVLEASWTGWWQQWIFRHDNPLDKNVGFMRGSDDDESRATQHFDAKRCGFSTFISSGISY